MTDSVVEDDVFHIPELDSPFTFTRRPVDLPGDLRPGWRIGLVVLLLKNCCRQGRVRFTQLHVLNWGVRSEENRRALVDAIAGTIAPDTLLVRIEPSLNRAVDLAIGEGLIRRRAGDRLELTTDGEALATEIERNPSLYEPERRYMSEIGKKVTAVFVERLFT
jgi:hypothetical protein